jgi:hypothetical protein
MPDQIDAKPTLTVRIRALGDPHRREGGRLDRLAARLRRPLDRRWFRRLGRLDQLQALGAGSGQAPTSKTSARVLVLALRNWPPHVAYEAVIAQALRLRGAQVALLTCGGGQPICEVGWARRMTPRPCDRCGHHTDQLIRGSGLEGFRLVDEFPWGKAADRAPADPSQLPPSSDPYSVGRTSAAWFVKSADIPGAPEGAVVATDFAVSAAAVQDAAGRILDRFRPDVVFSLNGLFAAEQAVREVADARGLRTPTYELAPREGTLVFGRSTPAPHMDTTALWEQVRERELTAEQSAELERLIHARAKGHSAHERYFDKQIEDVGAVRAALGLPSGTRVVSAFTNLAWDSALLDKDVAYTSMFEWLAHAASTVQRLEDVTFVIRVHPAESRWGTRQPVAAELAKRLGDLPSNVRLVDASDELSSYAIMAISQLVLTYTSTVGIEAAARGKPVAVAGETHYRGRGFTVDLRSPAELETLLTREAWSMSDTQLELARRYAFAFFFRFMIPFPAIAAAGPKVTRLPSARAELQPGRDPYLDFVCDRILDGKDFFLPEELALPVSSRGE